VGNSKLFTSLLPCPVFGVHYIAAWTLNHVKPRYYTSLLAPLTPRPEAEREMKVQIELAIALGLKKLKTHPHHG